MDINLQLASPDDTELILPLVGAYHEFEHLESTEVERESVIRKLLQNPEFGGIWLIYSCDELTGYIAICRGYSLEFGGFDAFIDEFFIKEKFRGKGIGTKVLEIIKLEAKKLEIKALHLEVARDNHSAQKLYRKVGFEARDKYMLMSLELGGE
ncbi:MAG: GNAT family N-acetyltransferase [Leptolyngbya sp. SIO1D8]|nr:GNAT family N-acetyltransferase [Leptolyngbya sp. SIO1D8]